ncbi:serine-rich adhesin for platelets-like isoform X4 [Drosophila pseudoobscura]|uniref:Serine-rich adhesin for platelets-like isoform X4 n=1 Tax=Drosophila pseudoobscura pseudoobscura TaxID=46245 RepID=A0A6I8W707_DROPS|nr:serine-rich adhesin for platelets isoform X4 [Drosophila pseudoobscura]
MKLSVSAYRAHASAHKKILSSGYHSQLNYGSTGAAASSSSSGATATGLYTMETHDHEHGAGKFVKDVARQIHDCNSDTDVISPTGTSSSGGGAGGASGVAGGAAAGESSGGYHKRHHKMAHDDDNHSAPHSSDSKSPSQRNKPKMKNFGNSFRKSRIGDGASDPDSDWTRSNQRWMKLRTTVQISSAIQKKPPLKREDSFLKRFSTRQIPETQETVEDTGSESASGDVDKSVKRRRRYLQKRRSVVNPDENFYFYWLMMVTVCVLYNLWTLIVRQSFPELQQAVPTFWLICDSMTDVVFILDIIVQLRTGYLEQGLMVYDDRKLACHYVHSRDFIFDMIALIPLDLLQLKMGTHPLLRFTRFFKVYRSVRFYYIVESRTVWPNLWRVVNLIHILLILAHWFGCFYFLLSEAEGFQGDWVYPYRPGDYATLTRKYLGSLYWSTLTLTTIGDLPTPETNAEPNFSVDGPRSIPRRGIKSRLLQFGSSYGYIFTIVSYLIGVFIFATIVGQVGNVITNRNANRLEFERLLDGAKTYMRHHKVPGGMKRRVLRWYDYSWSRGRIQGGGDINTALGLLPDKLKTELALHVNLSVLKKVTIFQECQPEFLHDLVLKMKAYIFTPGDSICRKGEVAREMFIIADGILEVLSETGKVLTTMKAGDFFGEIGILNLDGLNKRTADVRSVGYSELFSLSREDVLAAMKDYPDAQEILQTLGRKRLMEVRCVNKKYAKAALEKENAAYAAAHPHHHQAHHQGQVHQSDSSENSASKKIVDKLKHDVKGFRNVLKKSRTSRKSDESLEMQPLHNTSPRGSKIMLKRMSRVRSDEKDADTADAKDELHDKTPSPIGAGLPLLQRLRLLKEKQESIQEEPEREFNEGFPLIQRLQQLKIKNEPQANAGGDSGLVMVKTPPSISSKIDFGGATAAAAGLGTGLPSGSQLLTVAQIKPIMKVSFKQKIQQIQGGGASGSSPGPSTGAIAKKEPPKSLALIAKHASTLPLPPAILAEEKASGGVGLGGGVGPGQALAIATISKKVTKPSYKLNTPMQSDTDTDGTPISKPWSKLKLATLMSSSYTSLTNCSPDDLATPLKNYSLSNIPQQMEATAQAQSQSLSRPRHHSARSSSRSPRHAHGHGHAHDSTSNTSSSASQASTKRECLRLQKPEQQLPDGELAEPRRKFYQSVFDLSPEYSGLPFVKRLKILNERQKLAELEKALQTRSFSLDCSKSDQGGNLPITESLYRCYSDTSGIYSQFLSAYESTTSSTSISTNTSASASASASASDTGNSRHGQMQYVPLPLSPESNETVERRKLKSILKKLQKGGGPNGGSGGSGNGSGGGIGGGDAQDEATATVTATAHAHASRVLLAEPTLEGPPASAKEEGQFAAFGGASGVAHSQHSQHAIALSPSNGNGNGTANGNGKNSSNGSGSGMGTAAFSSNPMYPFPIPVAVPLPVSETHIWSPTLTLVTPTNSPQESFAFELQPQSQSQPQPQPHLQFPPPPVLEGSDSDGIGGLVAGVGSASTSSALGAAASSSLLSLSSAGAAATAAAASTSYVVECSSSSVSSKSNQILSQNTEFHAQSTTSTDLNLNLQLRQNTTTSTTNNALAGGSQGPRPEGFPEAQDYFNQILSGINHVIKTHMNEMHSKFETQFSSMAGEVRRRDAIIAQLQLKLRSIEQKSSSTASSSAAVPSSVLAIARRQKREKLSQISVDDDEPAEEENSSSGSSAELLFMRGDSLDTVFTSSPPIQGGRRSISPGPGPSRHHAASANALNCPSSYYSGPGTLSTRHAQSHPSFYTGQGNGRSSSRGYREWSGAAGDGRFSGADGSKPSGMVVSDVTGNLTRLSDSVILDIGESSSSSSSSSKLNIAEEEDDEDEEEAEAEAEAEADEELTASGTGNNDWEVRMLAAEMERQERKRGHSLSDNLGDLKHCSTFLRRRRKFSDTETEFSETDMDEQLARGSGGPIGSGTSGLAGEAPATGAGPTSSGSGIQSGSQRPRASSLDQFNLRYGIGRGIFKAMSIDRDKDKL